MPKIIEVIIYLLLFSLIALYSNGCAMKAHDKYQEPSYHETSSNGDHWEAGVAVIDITPKGTVYIAGYDRDRKSKDVHDPLSIRCLALSNGKITIGIVSFDLLGMLNPDIIAMKNLIYQKTNIPQNLIITGSSHTHSGPDITGLWGTLFKSGRDEVYIASVRNKSATCMQKAYGNIEPITLTFASGEYKITEFDGDVENIPDAILTVMQGKTKNDTLFTLTNFAVHPHMMNNHSISSDSLHSFYTSIKKQTGGIGIFLNGAEANIGPNTPYHRNDWDGIDTYGKLLASSTFNALQTNSMQSSNYTIVMRSDVKAVKLENWMFKLAVIIGLIPDIINDNGDVRIKLGYFRIGELQIATIPGEAFPNIAKDLRKSMTQPYNIICGLCDGAYGYIAYPKEYKEFDYHRSMSVGPIGKTVYKTLKNLIQKK